MPIKTATTMVSFAAALAVAAPASAQQHSGGHWGGGAEGWHEHESWHRDIKHFDHGHWRAGHWWHGAYANRDGWWWIVGPDWYWYPTPVYPYPDPFTPPGLAPGYWYYCDSFQTYYPYVGACPSGWTAVTPG
jgi:hypothetical protein